MMRTFKIKKSGMPDLSQMMLATVKALKVIGGSASIQELDEKVIELEGVPEEEQAYMMPDDHRPKINYFLAWCRTYLKRGNALENSSRGIWALTELGEKINSVEETAAIIAQVKEEEKQRLKAKRDKSTETKNNVQSSTVNGIEEHADWEETLLSVLRKIDPSAFERLSQRLLREAGFVKVEVRGKTGDGGIDGIGVLRVNLVSFQVYFQCKRYKGSVGSKEIRDFRGALQGRADKGLFITTGTFTSQASEEATRDGAIAIDLIDGERLCELLKQYDLGVKTTMIEKVDINAQWFAGI